MMKSVLKLLDRIFVVIGALIFFQAPIFIQQYQQNLLGHVDELRFQLEAMQGVADRSGKTLEQFVTKFLSSEDIDFFLEGQVMSHMIERYKSLSSSLAALDQASLFSKPFVFLSYYNHDIAASTASAFTLGIPLTMEGIVYAFIGVLAGWLLFSGLCFIVKSLGRLAASRASGKALRTIKTKDDKDTKDFRDLKDVKDYSQA